MQPLELLLLPPLEEDDEPPEEELDELLETGQPTNSTAAMYVLGEYVSILTLKVPVRLVLVVNGIKS